jgi:hypothetical protein
VFKIKLFFKSVTSQQSKMSSFWLSVVKQIALLIIDLLPL